MICVVVINFYILINITNFPPIMRSRGAGQLTAVELSTVIVKRQYGANRVVCCVCYCEFFNDLKPSGHYMYRQFNTHKFYVLPTQLYLCVLCGSQNKQRLFPYTALTDWFL